MLDAPTRREAESDELELADEIALISAELGTDCWVWLEIDGELIPMPACIIETKETPEDFGLTDPF